MNLEIAITYFFFSMDESQNSLADFPPLPNFSQPRLPTATGPTIVGTSPAITPGFGHPSAYDAFLADDGDNPSYEDMEADTSRPSSPPTQAPDARLQEFLTIIGNSTLTTDLVLVSFIPDNIKPEPFATFMDSITSMLISDSARQNSRPPVYKRPGFIEFFSTKPPLWMVLYHAAEQHGSFLLPLPLTLTFSSVGSFYGLQPPRFFTVPLHKRTCLVQAVPSDFKATFCNSPELAYWRGLGSDLTAGHHHVIQNAIEARTNKVFADCVAAGEIDASARHFSYLALHYVNIQEDGPRAKPKTKGKGPQPKPHTERHSWLECFVVTVSTIPVGRDSVVFQSLLPPEAPFGTKLHFIDLFGWRGEIASHLSLFRTWIYSPDPKLFDPQPVMRFSAIRSGWSLPSLCDTLKKDYQTLEGVLFCFIQRGRTDTFFLVTDGRTLSVTPSLRAISYGGGTPEPDIPGMSAQRQFYRLFNQVTPPPKTKGPQTALRPLPLSRPNPRATTPSLSYAAMVQSAPPTETAMRQYVHQETRLVVHELSTSLTQEASTLISTAMAPMQEELRKAHAEIVTLKNDLALQSATSKNTLTIVQHHTKTMQEQRTKDLEMQRLLYDTMKAVGLPLPEDAESVLAPPPKRRLAPSPDSSPMEASHG